MDPDLPAEGCNTFDDQCPRGEKCNAYASDGGGSWDALACFPLDPAPVGVGEECTVEGSSASGIDNCVQGAICWNVDSETNTGRCLAYCEGTPDDPSCANGSPCITTNEDALNICLPSCDPLLVDCAANEVCIPVNEVFVCAPDASGDMGVAGDPCDYLNVCDPGLWCAATDVVPGCFNGFGCCAPICDVTDPGADAACGQLSPGTECVEFYEMGMAPMGLEDVGSCIIP